MTSAKNDIKQAVPIVDMPLSLKHWLIVIVASMEQLIGAGLSTIIGIMLPMMKLASHPDMSSGLQGFIGACGLIGIGIGSAVIGKMSDRQGYLVWFRLCPAIIIAGSLICYPFTSTGALIAGLMLAGIGVGGGYSLDSAYISELMPDRWRQIMVGIAKGFCSIGFLAVAVIAFIILRIDPTPKIWNSMMLIIAALGAVTLLMRIAWWESPKWLMEHGEAAKAQSAARHFLGSEAEVVAESEKNADEPQKSVSWFDMFKGQNLSRVIFSGIPWACEGLGVYGFGVFLPVLVMALGLAENHATGILKITDSVEMTAVVNFFIIPGFIIGLLLLRRHNHTRMMATGFLGAALGLVVLLVAFLLKLPAWIMVVGFVIFELALNAGPHLITFIIPSAIYPVSDRGTGTGIAALLGKVGAVAGVVLMPLLLDWGGMTLVLAVSAAVMLLGGAISLIYGKKLNLL